MRNEFYAGLDDIRFTPGERFLACYSAGKHDAVRNNGADAANWPDYEIRSMDGTLISRAWAGCLTDISPGIRYSLHIYMLDGVQVIDVRLAEIWAVYRRITLPAD